MVSTIPSYRPAGARRSVGPFLLSFVSLDVCYVVVAPALVNRYQSTMDTHLRGGSSFCGNDAGSHCRGVRSGPHYENNFGAHLLGWIATRQNTSCLRVFQ